MTDPLDKFIVDEGTAVDVKLLAQLIDGFFQFTKTGEVIFERKFVQQSESKKVLLLLLGRKVIKYKNLITNYKEESGPKELSDQLGIESKQVSKYLARELRNIVKSKNKAYYVPNYNLYKCEELLKNDKPKRNR